MYLYTDNNNTLMYTAAKRVSTQHGRNRSINIRSLLAIEARSLEI